ncbi:MAG: tetratricopeptide repeat protein [Desulfovibrio sp.]|jgi:tetratricopeptide (TPR) repeat protein|nr:tetratricopeptide repeat protein [Desulfovibrio sp.]
MTDTQRPHGPTRVLILLLALGFAAMLFVALTENFHNPQLSVQRPPDPTVVNADGAGDNIGMLMQQAAKEPQNADVLIHLVEALIAAQNWGPAETFAKRAVSLDLQDQRPLYLLGIVKHNLGHHQEAAETLEKALAVKDTAALRYSLGVLYLYFLRDTPQGVRHLNAGLHDANADEDLKRAIREELEKASRPDSDKKTEAENVILSPARTSQNPGTPSIPRAIENKITEMEKTILRNPDDAASWTALGNLYFDTGRTQQAISAYERSLTLFPNNPDVLTDLGIMYRDAGKYSKAVENFRKAVDLNAGHENALFNEGVVLFYDMHNKEEALRVWRQLLDKNPNARAHDGHPVSEMIKLLQ